MPSSPQAKMLAKLIKRAKKREEDPFRPLLDEYLLKRERSETRHTELPITSMAEPVRPPGRLSPSSVGGCRKRAVFKFIGVPGERTVTPDLQMIFDDGNIRHMKWDWIILDMQAVLGKDVFEVISIEERVEYEPLYIAGSLDAVVRIYKKPWVIDFKGANLYSWNEVYMEQKPKVGHVWQLHSYMRARRIPRGMLIYENKNNQELTVVAMEFDKSDWEEVVLWAKTPVKALKRKRLPQMDPGCDPGNAMYSQCEFVKWCYGEMSVPEQEQLAYKNFEDIDTHWERGRELVSE